MTTPLGPAAPLPDGVDLAKFWQRVQRGSSHECWEWSGGHTAAGYSLLFVGGSSTVYAHRISYLVHVGPIPDGLEMDHLCENRGCVNWRHVEPVTTAENARRSVERAGPRCIGWFNRNKTHCPSGHPYDAANTYHEPSGRGRRCRTCIAEQQRAWRSRRKRAA